MTKTSNFTKALFILLFFWCSPSVFSTDLKNPPEYYDDDFIFSNAEVVDDFTTRIPFKIVDKLIMIEATYKNENGMFIVDTGSEKLLLNSAHYSHLIQQNNRNSNSYGVLNRLDNAVEKRIKNLVVQNLSIEDKRSDILDLSHIEKSKKVKVLGVLGYNVLKDYEVFIDLHLNQLTLFKIDKKGNKLTERKFLEKIDDSINFELKKHTIIIEGNINGKKLKFGLDTAAEFSQLNSKTSPKVLKSFYPNKRVKLIGASGRKIEVIAGRLFKLKLTDKTYFGPMNTLLTNLRSMNKAFRTDLDGLLGHDFFAQKRVVINYKKKKIYFINFPIIK